MNPAHDAVLAEQVKGVPLYVSCFHGSFQAAMLNLSIRMTEFVGDKTWLGI